MWLKKISLILAIIVIAGAVLFLTLKNKECCLCNTFRYHAPCLIDLKTGELVELRLYQDHPMLVAELSEEQPHYGTFSFVRLNGVSGTTQTGPERVDLFVPTKQSCSLLSATSVSSSCRLDWQVASSWLTCMVWKTSTLSRLWLTQPCLYAAMISPWKEMRKRVA